MAKVSADEILTQGNKRLFIQFGGPTPANAVKYSGKDTQYLSLTGISKPISGGVTAINVPDPNRFGRFKQIGRTRAAADLPSGSLEVMAKKGSLPFTLGDLNCPFNVYEVAGQCKTPSDWTAGWTDYVQIYSFAEATDVDMGDRTSMDGDEGEKETLSLTIDKIYAIAPIAFGPVANEEVIHVVKDACYGTAVQCGNCGPANDGTKRIYAVLAGAGGVSSPGLPANVVYSLDSGSTWTSTAIDSIGLTDVPVQIEVVGIYLVVLVSSSANSKSAIYFSELNGDTGAPGSFSKVQTGFVASKRANDMYIANAREIYFAADGGYIYKASDITAGVDRTLSAGDATSSNLKRIHGSESVIVAVGASGAIVKSTTRGETWSTTGSTPMGAGAGTAVQVMTANDFHVGDDAGYLYYTLNGGATWSNQSITGNGTGQITDIIFATDEVGYVSRTLSSVAYIYSTWNGGANWVSSGAPRLLSWPTFAACNRIALPTDADATVAVNNLLISGSATGAVDGLLLVGKAATL